MKLSLPNSLLLMGTLLFAPCYLAAQDSGALARVAILPFSDNTGQKNYGWIKTSLPDAIFDSMKSHFEFERADTSAVEKSMARSVAGESKLSVKAVDYMAGAYNFDIVIYGDYNYDVKTNLAQISAEIYHREGHRVIGKVVEFTKLDSNAFATIDTISQKIIAHIYRFSLDLNAAQSAQKGQENVRLLVLVPTWKNAAEKRTAIREIEFQKTELKKRYDAELLTIFEFFKTKKTPPKEIATVEGFAQTRNEKAIADWLGTQKVQNAMVVFVSDKNINLLPVSGGKIQLPITYAVGATPAQKGAAIESAITKSGMDENLKKTVLMNRPGIRDRYSLALSGVYLAPVGSAKNAIDAGWGMDVEALYRYKTFWIFQVGAAAQIQGVRQTHVRYDGDSDLTFSHFAGMLGPTLIVPFPFFRSLEFQFSLLGGAAYSMLQKYKYTNLTLSETALRPLFAAEAEVRWHIALSFFVGAATSYQHIFYTGTDMQSMTVHLRAGYRF